MNKRIYKYELLQSDQQVVSMPEGSEILTVQVQNGKPVLWALVDTDRTDPNKVTKLKDVHIEMLETGEPVDCDMGIERRYISTLQFREGAYIIHVFERL